jgi:putative endonuclease
MQPASHVDRGRHAEALAAAFLALRGYEILERNFRYSRLEIDLIARCDSVLAIVEVKYRAYGHQRAALAVTPQKQRDLETATVGYMKVKGLTGVRVRFDVVTLEPLPGEGAALVVRHIQSAFTATGRYRM